MDLEMPPHTDSYLNSLNKTAETFRDKWATELTGQNVAQIEKACHDFSVETGFDWKRFDPRTYSTKVQIKAVWIKIQRRKK